jgi:hypothetical protein
LPAELQPGSAKAVGQKSEVTDAHETSRKHVQKEPPQELVGSEGHRALLIAVRVISPIEGDALSIKGCQAVI